MYTMPHDKALHFIAGVLLFAVGHFIHPYVGLGMAVLYGAGKEAYDSLHPQEHTVDFYDFLYTVAGGVVGFVCWI